MYYLQEGEDGIGHGTIITGVDIIGFAEDINVSAADPWARLASAVLSEKCGVAGAIVENLVCPRVCAHGRTRTRVAGGRVG